MKAISTRARASIAFALIALATAACSGSSGASPTPNISPLANTDWTLTTISGRDLPAGTSVTLLFNLLQAGGFSGCNQFTVPYATQDTGLRFGPIAGTLSSCGTTIDAFQSGYFSSLSSVTHWGIANDVLSLRSGTGDTILVYSRQPPASVEGAWTITQVNNGAQAVSSVPSGVTANITFNTDGTVSGFSGCNNFSGGYSQTDPDKIAIGPLMSQLTACGDPADTFERQLLTALQTATKWDVTSGTLELRDDGGALHVAASSAAAQ